MIMRRQAAKMPFHESLAALGFRPGGQFFDTYVYFEDEPGRRSAARFAHRGRGAADCGIAKLPDLLRLKPPRVITVVPQFPGEAIVTLARSQPPGVLR